MANIVFKSIVNWSGEKVRCEADSRGHKVIIDEPGKAGGTNQGQTPVELLLSALGGCITISATAFARKARVELQEFSIELEGDMEPDGFLGKNPETKVGFSDIRYKIRYKTDSPQENVEKLMEIVKNRCPVSDTLISGVKVAGEWVNLA
ncbi:MAG: OsmC family protein [Carboxydocellales bacterium]